MEPSISGASPNLQQTGDRVRVQFLTRNQIVRGAPKETKVEGKDRTTGEKKKVGRGPKAKGSIRLQPGRGQRGSSRPRCRRKDTNRCRDKKDINSCAYDRANGAKARRSQGTPMPFGSNEKRRLRQVGPRWGKSTSHHRQFTLCGRRSEKHASLQYSPRNGKPACNPLN